MAKYVPVQQFWDRLLVVKTRLTSALDSQLKQAIVDPRFAHVADRKADYAAPRMLPEQVL